MSDHEPNKYRSDEMEEAGHDDVVRVSDEVIATIAGTVLAEVKGVASSAPGFVGGLLGRKGASKGVKIEADGNDVVVDVTIAVEYGARIPDVAAEIQARLRGAIEEMTGKFVRAVNVTVQGIRAPSGAPGIVEPVEEDDPVPGTEQPRQEG
jgi:uncharacterized alkaline shock family protein YloU